MNVVLVGFRGSGKTSVGRALAARLGREFVDCDDAIEKQARLSIREIFERHGESHFRTLESEAIGALAKLDGKVIATGGGAVLRYKNIQELKRHGGVVFWLRVAPGTACARMEGDPATRARRPALTDLDPEAEVRQQIEFRRPYYEKAADTTIETDGKDVEAVVAEILGHLGADPEPPPSDKDSAPA